MQKEKPREVGTDKETFTRFNTKCIFTLNAVIEASFSHVCVPLGSMRFCGIN